MSPSLDYEQQNQTNKEEELFLFAMKMATSTVLPMVLRAAIELNLLEIMSKSGDKMMSATEIATQIDTKNPNAPEITDRMLRVLSSHSVVACSLVTDKDGQLQRVYGLEPACKFLTSNEDGVSIANMMHYFNSKFIHDSWYQLKDTILEGGSPFYRAHGMHLFEYSAQDNGGFNQAMSNHSTLVMKKILENYDGFSGLNELMDVGGGIGANLRLIASKYPHIRCINFDLPHVVKNAPPSSGVEFIEGDMFQAVPKAENIFMKWIIHDWDDNTSIKLLKNCYEALPENGKLIIVESVAPELPEPDLVSQYVFNFDLCMLATTPTGKERTIREFESLARKAGFAAIKTICRAFAYSVIEFYKRV